MGGWKKRKQQTKGALTVAKGLGHHSKVVFDLLCDDRGSVAGAPKRGARAEERGAREEYIE